MIIGQRADERIVSRFQYRTDNRPKGEVWADVARPDDYDATHEILFVTGPHDDYQDAADLCDTFIAAYRGR